MTRKKTPYTGSWTDTLPKPYGLGLPVPPEPKKVRYAGRRVEWRDIERRWRGRVIRRKGNWLLVRCESKGSPIMKVPVPPRDGVHFIEEDV